MFPCGSARQQRVRHPDGGAQLAAGPHVGLVRRAACHALEVEPGLERGAQDDAGVVAGGDRHDVRPARPVGERCGRRGQPPRRTLRVETSPRQRRDLVAREKLAAAPRRPLSAAAPRRARRARCRPRSDALRVASRRRRAPPRSRAGGRHRRRARAARRRCSRTSASRPRSSRRAGRRRPGRSRARARPSPRGRPPTRSGRRSRPPSSRPGRGRSARRRARARPPARRPSTGTGRPENSASEPRRLARVREVVVADPRGRGPVRRPRLDADARERTAAPPAAGRGRCSACATSTPGPQPTTKRFTSGAGGAPQTDSARDQQQRRPRRPRCPRRPCAAAFPPWSRSARPGVGPVGAAGAGAGAGAGRRRTRARCASAPSSWACSSPANGSRYCSSPDALGEGRRGRAKRESGCQNG